MTNFTLIITYVRKIEYFNFQGRDVVWLPRLTATVSRQPLRVEYKQLRIPTLPIEQYTVHNVFP